jgi:hypothetical protein
MEEVGNDESFVLSEEESASSSSEGSFAARELSSDSDDLDYQGPRRGPRIFYKLTYSESANRLRSPRARRAKQRDKKKKSRQQRRRQRQEEEERATIKLTRSYLEHMKLGAAAIRGDDDVNALHFFERALALAEQVLTIDKSVVLDKIAAITAKQQQQQQQHEQHDDVPLFTPPRRAHASPAAAAAPAATISPRKHKFHFPRTAEMIFEEKKRHVLIEKLVAQGQTLDRVNPDQWSRLVHAMYTKLPAEKKQRYEELAAMERE